MKKFTILLKGDLKNIARDKMFLFILVAPIITGAAFKIIISYLEGILLVEFAFDLSIYFSFIFIFIMVIIPMISGILAAFLILEDRDQGLLSYLSITPLSKDEYLIYRLLISFIISFISVVFAYYIVQIAAVNISFLLPVIMMAVLGGPLMVLLVAVFADDKVEGFAFAKGAGILFLFPLAAYFIESKLSYLFAIFPSFWVYQSFEVIDNGLTIYLINVLLGILIHLLFIYFLYRKFKKRVD